MTGLSRPRSAGNSCAVRASGGRWRYQDSVRIPIRGLRSLSQYRVSEHFAEMQSAFCLTEKRCYHMERMVKTEPCPHGIDYLEGNSESDRKVYFQNTVFFCAEGL